MVWAVSLSTMKLSPHRLTLPLHYEEFGVYQGFPTSRSSGPTSALPLRISTTGYTYIYFEENQLFPGSIAIFALPTVHHATFQRCRVRASTPELPGFHPDHG